MNAQREKVTVSLFNPELVIIEKLKNQLSDQGLLVQPTTSEIVRLALHVLAETAQTKLESVVDVLEDRRVGRPKKKPSNLYF